MWCVWKLWDNWNKVLCVNIICRTTHSASQWSCSSALQWNTHRSVDVTSVLLSPCVEVCVFATVLLLHQWAVNDARGLWLPSTPFCLFALCAALLFCWLISFPSGRQTRFLAFVGEMKGGLRDGYWTLHGKEVGCYSPIQSPLPVQQLPFIYICFLKDITEKSKVLQEIKENQQVGQRRLNC